MKEVTEDTGEVPQDKKYKIAWVSEATEKQGSGNLAMDQETAETVAKRKNNEFPGIRHDAVPIKEDSSGSD